jgi:mitochondrial GTPase 1
MRRIIGVLRSNYERKYEKVGLWLSICGMPNVGKSTIINQIRMISDLPNKVGAAKATATVATTRGMRGFKILQNPLMYLIDSPGVMVPSNILP